MADFASPLGTIAIGQGDQAAKANGLFDALSPSSIFGYNYATTTGLTFGYHGGKMLISGIITAISSGTLSLSASSTNYIEAHPDTGVVSKNTTAFTAGYLPVAVATTNTTAIVPSTGFVDSRTLALASNATLAKALSDAAYTLTQADANNYVLAFSGTLTATRNITIPLVGKKQWTVYNGTGQSLVFIGPTGTGITVATLKHAIVRSDGTNIVRVMADT